MILVMAVGCFDVLHYGHLRHLKAGKKLGDRLLVCLTTAKHVNKGPKRPVFTDAQRAEMLLELKCVDEVVINPDPTPEKLIVRYRPQIYIKGSEYKDALVEQPLVEALGGKVVFTDEPVYSSTKLVSGGY